MREMTEGRAILEIAKRAAVEIYLLKPGCLKNPILHTLLNVEATHKTCRLDLHALLAADIIDFTHDILGINRHLNRSTGKLDSSFSPKFSLEDLSQ